ncbi:MAG: hypothetical protein VXZ27_12270, partial [SAR324 cluster bacterium]|nr:hypothetical protein [SAR324 cluster bacterium]
DADVAATNWTRRKRLAAEAYHTAPPAAEPITESQQTLETFHRPFNETKQLEKWPGDQAFWVKLASLHILQLRMLRKF